MKLLQSITVRRHDEEPAATVRRVDRIAIDEERLRKAHRTSEGFLVMDAFAARPGVYEYPDGRGGVVRELVDADTLRRTADLGTLGRKPLTLRHPDTRLTPDSVGQHMIGSVGEQVHVEADGFVRVSIAVHRGDGIRAIESEGWRELSCGYDAEIDRTPGVWTAPDGTQHRYDQRQVSRSYEHIALVPAGRHGSQVRARLDNATADNGRPGEQMKIKRKVRLDAKSTTEIEAEPEVVETIAKLEAHRDAESARADAAEAQVREAEGKLAATQAELAQARADAEAAKVSPEDLQKRIDERAELMRIATANGVPADEARKLDDAGLRRRVVEVKYPTLKLDGWKAEQIDGAFEVVASSAPAQPADPLGAMSHTVPAPAGNGRADADDWSYGASFSPPKKA